MSETTGNPTNTDIFSQSYEALLRYLMPRVAKPHHDAKAICKGLYRDLVTDFSYIADISSAALELLHNNFSLYTPKLLNHVEDSDSQTRKDLIALQDGNQVEVVMMRYRQRYSLCISSQVGCACNCSFCATGQMGLVRQMTPGEIISQVNHAQRILTQRDLRAENIVLMGMGEPLLNYDAVIAALHNLVDGRTLNFAPRHITVSTAGIASKIVAFANDAPPVKLAISLHAATDELRNTLMPINQRYPLTALFEAVHTYTEITRRRVMFEWTMIAGVNDTPEQAYALAKLCEGIPSHINFIPLNSTEAYPEQPSPTSQVQAFGHILDDYSIPHTMRQRRGNAITSGCGQLRSRELKIPHN